MNWSRATRRLIDLACDEDLGPGDITSALLPDFAQLVTARLVPRRPGIICGLAVAPAICTAFARRVDEALQFAPAPHGSHAYADGDPVVPGTAVGTLAGPKALVLAAERTLLNFLGRLSGVATLTRRFVEAAHAANPDVRILDTRKTMPGWRELDKYAVRTGGGHNHRQGLFDAVLIKDNHLAHIPPARLAAELTTMLDVTWPHDAQPSFIEVEVDSLAQFEQVCQVPAVSIVLLDNFTPADIRAAVALRDGQGLRGRLELEASGGVTLETVGEIAATGIDHISVGALTHSAPALDLGLDL